MQWSPLMEIVDHSFLKTTKELIPGPDYFLQLVVFAKCLKACRCICRKIEQQLLSRGLFVNGKTGNLEMLLVDVTYCVLNRMTSAVQSSLEVVVSIRIIPGCLFLIPLNFLIFFACLFLAFSKIEMIIFKYFSRERPLQKSILVEELIGFKIFSLYPQIPVLNAPGFSAC